MLHRPLQTGRQELPQIEAKDTEGKQGWAKNSCYHTFSAGQCSAVFDVQWLMNTSGKPHFLGAPFSLDPWYTQG